MKLTIERADALRAVALVTGIAARKSTIAILSNLLLETDEHGLTIVATDMSIEIMTRCPARIENGGATTVSADKLLEIIKNLPDGADMLLSNEEKDEQSRLFVKAGKSTFRMPQLPPSDFPRLSQGESGGFGIPAGDLVAMIDDSSFMGDMDDSRPYVQSIYIHTVGASLRCVGASGNGLAYRDVDAPDAAVGFEGEMISLDHAGKLRSLLAAAKADATISVSGTEGQIAFNIGGSVVRCLTVNGGYVDYPAVIARSAPTHTLTADVDLLTGAVKRALIMQTERVRMLVLNCRNGVLSIKGQNMQAGESADSVDVDVNEDFEMKVKGPQLLDVLSRIRTESVVMKFAPAAGNSQPIVITETGEPRSLFIIMPMSL